MTAGPDQTGASGAEHRLTESGGAERGLTESSGAERDVTWLDDAEFDQVEEDLPAANPTESASPADPVLSPGDSGPAPGAAAGTGVTGTGVTGTGVTGTGVTGTGVNGDDERWHDIVARFIDDPRSSVSEAAELVEAEVTALIALLSRRRDSLGETWQTSQVSEAGGATEELRLAMRGYREFSSQLAASVKALS